MLALELLTVPTPAPELQLPATSEVSPHSHPSECEPFTFQYPELQESIRQFPPAQVSEACGKLQALPQEPQLAVVSREDSQPVESTPSQSPHNVSQLTITQLPPEVHVSVAWARLQTCPQPPQLSIVTSSSSQPFESTPSQFPQGWSQLPMWQLPPEHDAVAWLRLQETPQAPQSVNDSRDTSQPSASNPLQSSHRSSHWPRLQTPPAHVSVA
jgi:hypothetical protein